MAKRVRNRRKAAKVLKRRPRSWLGVACVLLSLASVALTTYETDEDGKITDPSVIFTTFADLSLGVDEVARMRGSPNPPVTPPHNARWRWIIGVPDGDTLKLDGNETVRLLGVDTPESDNNRKLREDIYKTGLPIGERAFVALGKRAAEFTTWLALGRQCWLEYENEETDQYGRTVAYVHLQDGRIVNEEIIRQGFGKAYLSYAFKYRKRYVLLQAEARFNRAGLWRETRNTGAPVQGRP